MSEHATTTENSHHPQSITLVGLMGAGKSTVGRRLAKALHLKFYDADNEIVEAAGCSISDIFEIYGEPIFRDLEKRVMLRLLEGPPCVIAAGGGAFMTPHIRDAVQKYSLSIWLNADIETLLARVTGRSHRPILEQGNKRQILSNLIEQRYPIYEAADLTIDSAKGNHEEIVKLIIAELQAKGWNL